MTQYILISLTAIAILCYGYYNEEKLIEFEHKILVKICKWILKMATKMGIE